MKRLLFDSKRFKPIIFGAPFAVRVNAPRPQTDHSYLLGGFTRRGTAVRFVLLLLFGDRGFTRRVFYVLQASVTHQ